MTTQRRAGEATGGLARGAARSFDEYQEVWLTLALAAPAVVAALAVARLSSAGIAILASVVAAAAQLLIPWFDRTLWHGGLRTRRLMSLLVAVVLAGVLSEVIIPSTFVLSIPVVGLAAAIGLWEGTIIGLAAVGLYLVPIVVRAAAPDPDRMIRSLAAATVCVLVAAGARYFVGRLQATGLELRRANARERRRVRQIEGIEQVGRLLAGGTSADALSGVVDLLVDRFNYQYVSIYLARPDQQMQLGAQRGYTTTVDLFDGTVGVVGRVMRERQAYLVADVTADPDYIAADPRIVSEISAPMIVADVFLGVLNVESSGRVLDTTDLRLVVSVADQLGAYVALGRDRERLADLAIRDPLTGLHNRRFLDDSLRRLFAARARQAPEAREGLAMILFDLDHFGELNKRSGLAAGDAVLRRFGQILASAFREADLVARYGGEEFLVVLAGASVAHAENRANGVRALLAAPSEDQAADAQSVTVSAGCAAITADQECDAARLIAAADVALNQAKRAGRDRVVSAAL